MGWANDAKLEEVDKVETEVPEEVLLDYFLASVVQEH